MEIPEGLGYTEDEMWDEAMKGKIEWEDHMRIEAIECLFSKSTLDDEYKELSLLLRIFYWVKCFLCLCLDRTWGSYLNGSISMVVWNFHSNGYDGGQSWMGCWVEKGIFKNWRVCVTSDGT